MSATLDAFTSFANEIVHKHRREFVFADGVVLGDVLDAIAAAGAIGNYVLANQLSIQYALDVCVRCATRFVESKTGESRTPLSDLGVMTSWGSVCSLCKLQMIAYGETRRL